MGSNGFMQHPEVVPMEPDEYDELIASPIDFYLEKFSPASIPNLIPTR